MTNEELAAWLAKEVKICGCFAYRQFNEGTGATCEKPILR